MVYKAFFHNSNWFLEKCEKPSKVNSKKRDRAGIKLLHCIYKKVEQGAAVKRYKVFVWQVNLSDVSQMLVRWQALVNISGAAATHTTPSPVALKDVLDDNFLYLL